MEYKGINVCQWQGNIDLYKIKASGYQVAYIKASEGIYFMDPFFNQNCKKVIRAGMSVGFYHTLTARSKNQAKQQAYFFVSVINKKEYHLRPAVDIKDLEGLSPNEINEIAATFLETVEQLIKERPMIYSNKENAMLLQKSFKKYFLWIEQSGESNLEGLGNWNRYTGWEYKKNARLNGTLTTIDLSVFTENCFIKQDRIVKNEVYPPTSKKTSIIYEVKEGDTIKKIARLYHITETELVKENDIKDGKLPLLGEKLNVTIYDRASSKRIYYYYKVIPNDTLNNIAKRYHTTVKELVQLNGIKTPDLIFPGQIIKIEK